MGYSKTIEYGNLIEIYEYEKDIQFAGRKGRKIQNSDSLQGLSASRRHKVQQGKPIKAKDPSNARRSAMGFRRLVSANLGDSDHPLLVSLTYAKSVEDIGQAHKDFNAFARAVRSRFTGPVRYVAVPEFQKRGAVHFHALFWGLPTKKLAETERRTRFFASLWRQGFVDLVATDGDEKIAGYLSKYMSKAFLDPRLLNKKAYVCSQNIKRPVVVRKALISPLFYGGLMELPDLSTAELLQDSEYMTRWLGKGRKRLYKFFKH